MRLQTTKIMLLCMLCLVLCSADKRVVVTWIKYDIANNPDVERLSLWEVNPDTQWVRTITDFISPYDTSYSFIVPSADAYGTKHLVMIAIDSSENRSKKSNVASITFVPDAVEGLKAQIK